MKTILAPIDFSSVSDAVVAEAATLARGVSGRVVLLSVYQLPAVMQEYANLMDNITEITAAGERNAERQLGRIQADLAEDGIPSETVLLSGTPVAVILRQAERFEADYVVMGSHGHTALYDLPVGSTTHGVLKRATCPVIIVPAARAAKAKKEERELYAVP